MELTLDELAEEITTLAAHVSAATCRWLQLVAEFDRREGWGAWGCKSCADWIAWRCSIVRGAAREHVRVARRLEDLPLICAAFARGELSFSKVRALTRVQHVANEQELLDLARSSTASQLERLIRRYRGVAAVEAGHEMARRTRFVEFHHDDDGAMVIRGRFPAEEGAIIQAAVESARAQIIRDRRPDSDSHADHLEEPVLPEDAGALPYIGRGASNADALLAVAEAAGAVAVGAAGNGTSRAEVLVHVDLATLTGAEGATVGVLEDGAPLPAETVRRLCCDAAIVPMTERDGRPLSVGRRTRTIPSSLRRALSRRDGGCRFPGCHQRRGVDAHHIRHWARGGETSAENLVLLCRHHHRLVHEDGYRVERRGGRTVFRRPDGRPLRLVPRGRRGDLGCLVDHHERVIGLRIDSETSVPDWWGEPLALDPAMQALLVMAPVTEPPGI